MTEWHIGGAFALGVLTALQPCALAATAGGVAWSLGWAPAPRSALVRAVALVAGVSVGLAALAAAIAHLAVAAAPSALRAASFWQPFQGPFLLAAGALVAGILGRGTPAAGRPVAGAAKRPRGLAVLSMLALAGFMCPSSAGVFFLLVVPMAAAAGSPVLCAAAYGAGIAAPALAVVLAVAAGTRPDAKTWRVARVTQRSAGILMLSLGAWLTLRLIARTWF